MTKQGVPHEHKGARYMNSEEIVLSLRKNKHFFFQVSIVVLIIGTVAGAQLFQNKDTNLANNKNINQSENIPITLDELSATEIAAGIALSSDNIVKSDVVSQAESIAVKESIALSSEEFISKPATSAKDGSQRSAIINHLSIDGETLESIAQKYDINVDTIRWANNIAGNNLEAGKKLLILPVDGILYTVQAGDTAESIALLFSVDAARIINVNDAEISGLQAGVQITIPDARPLSESSKSNADSQRAKSVFTGNVFGSLDNFCEPSTVSLLGRVREGDVIGMMGSTGSSSGKHLHLGICSNGSYIDPVKNRQTREMVAGFAWPLKDRQAEVSRWFDCSRYWAAARGNCPAGWYFHAGVDITEPYSKQTQILAVGDGEMIFRGYQYGSGYTVMIRHDNGYISQYRHMLPF